MPEILRRWITGAEKKDNALRFATLFAIFFSPALAYLAITFNGGNTFLLEDGLLAQFPFRVFLHNAFVNGFSPQWMPSSACGISLLAEGQSAICFPSTQIIFRLFSAETGWIIEILVAHFAAFAFCYFFFKHLCVSSVSSFFGASVYAFCPLALGLTGIPSMIWCYALLPAIFLWCDHFIEQRPSSILYLMAVIALYFLTGHPVMIIYVGMVIVFFIVFRMITAWPRAKTFRETWLFILALFSSIFAAILIASPQLLPMLEEFRFSARTVGTGLSLDALQNSLHLQPDWLPLSLFPTPPHFNEWGFWSNIIRFPFYVLFLCSIGMLFGEKGTHWNYFIFLIIFTILMALGPYVGLWKIVHSLPVLRHFRFPFRWLFFLPICVAFFSARGLDYLLHLPNGFPSVGFGRILKSLLLAVLAVGVILSYQHHSKLMHLTRNSLESSQWLTVLLWICVIGMVITAFLSLNRAATRLSVIAGAALTVISLIATIAFNLLDPMAIRNLETIGWKGGNPPSEPQTYRTSSALPPYEVWMAKTIHKHYSYTSNLTVLNGTLGTGHYFSFFPYWSANISAWSQDALKGDHNKQIYLDLSSARWLFIPDGPSAEKVDFPTASVKGANAYENPNARPRASVVFSHRLFSNEVDLVSFLESSSFDPRRDLAILKKDAEAWNLRQDANEQKSTVMPPEATIVVDRPDRIEINLKPAAPAGAFLVLSDTYYPGWRALADGVEAKILRSNYAFRGIKLPEGAKHVVFFNDPLVPDAVLPLPTILLAAFVVAMLFRHWLIARRKADPSTYVDNQ